MNKAYLLATAGTVCLALPAGAQENSSANESGGGLQEIIVTAQKRAENLQNVPISVAAVSSSQLQAAGVVSALGLSNSVAGLTINQTSSFFSPHLRGVGTSFFGPGIENPVGLYVDGIYYGSQLMAPTNMSNVNQVAVLKGPQGTLFGRNSTGGVIQMTTREPKDEFGAEVSTELDQYMTSRNFAYLTGGLAPGLKANLSLAYATQGEGWGKNLVTGTDIHKIDRDFAVRSKWQLESGPFTAKLNLDYANRKDSLGQNVRPLKGTGQALHGLSYGATVDPSVFFGANFTGSNYTSSNPYDSALNVDNRNHFEGGGVGLTLEYDLDVAKLVSITGYRKFDFHTISDTDASTDLSNDIDLTEHARQWTQEVQLLSRDDPNFNWVIGAYYYNNRDKVAPLEQDFGYFGPIFAGSIFDDGTFADLQTATYSSRVAVKSESYAFFAQATVAILPETKLTGGFRWTHELRKMSGVVTSQYTNFDGTPANAYVTDFLNFCGAGSVPDDPVCPGVGRISESKPTWRVSLDHKFTPDILGYVSYNRGYKSGGFNALQPFGAASTYRPEKVDAYEAGFKAELLDRTLRLNPSFFYNKYSNLQVLNLNDAFAIVGNAEGARMYGVDLDGQWQATDNLGFSFGAEWLSAKFTKFLDMPVTFPVDPANPADGYVAADIPNGKGNYLPFAPKFSANIGVDYSIDVREAKLNFNVTESYNSGYYFEQNNAVKQKSFSLLNASVTWTSPDEHLSIGIFGRNLLDKAVPTQVSTLPLPVGGGVTADYANPPRTYGFTAKYKFGS